VAKSSVVKEFKDLVERMDTEEPSPGDMKRLRALVPQLPDFMDKVGDLTQQAALRLFENIPAGPASREVMEAGWKKFQSLKKPEILKVLQHGSRAIKRIRCFLYGHFFVLFAR
jgi:hypothetical protein